MSEPRTKSLSSSSDSYTTIRVSPSDSFFGLKTEADGIRQKKNNNNDDDNNWNCGQLMSCLVPHVLGRALRFPRLESRRFNWMESCHFVVWMHFTVQCLLWYTRSLGGLNPCDPSKTFSSLVPEPSHSTWFNCFSRLSFFDGLSCIFLC